MQNMKQAAMLALAPLLIVSLVACQPAEEGPQSVEERAQARWDHVLANEHSEAWAYFSPGFRDLMTAREYARDMRLQPFKWTSARVIGSECQENQCDVIVSATYKTVRGPSQLRDMEMAKELTEKWVRTEQQWWLVKN